MRLDLLVAEDSALAAPHDAYRRRGVYKNTVPICWYPTIGYNRAPGMAGSQHGQLASQSDRSSRSIRHISARPILRRRNSRFTYRFAHTRSPRRRQRCCSPSPPDHRRPERRTADNGASGLEVFWQYLSLAGRLVHPIRQFTVHHPHGLGRLARSRGIRRRRCTMSGRVEPQAVVERPKSCSQRFIWTHRPRRPRK